MQKPGSETRPGSPILQSCERRVWHPVAPQHGIILPERPSSLLRLYWPCIEDDCVPVREASLCEPVPWLASGIASRLSRTDIGFTKRQPLTRENPVENNPVLMALASLSCHERDSATKRPQSRALLWHLSFKGPQRRLNDTFCLRWAFGSFRSGFLCNFGRRSLRTLDGSLQDDGRFEVQSGQGFSGLPRASSAFGSHAVDRPRRHA